MKTKRNLIIAVCLCLSSYCMAETFKEITDNWLQNAPSNGRQEIPDGDDDGMTDTPDTPNVPVGDAVWLVAGMSAVYALYRCKLKS
jgi:hypothetical protein